MQPTPIESAATFVVLAAVAIYVALRRERTGVHWLLLMLLAAMMIWTGGLAVFWLAEDGPRVRAGLVTAFLGVFMVPPCWLMLAAHQTNLRVFDQRPGWLIAALVPSAMSALAVVTNAGHRLFIRDFDRDALTGPALQWAGPVFWVAIGLAALEMLVGMAIYLWVAVRTIRQGQHWRGLTLAAIVIGPTAAAPLVATLLSRDLTPTLLALMTLMLFALNWRHRVLETLPIARRDVIEHLRDGVVLADGVGGVLDVNPAAAGLLGADLSTLRGESMALLLQDLASESARASVQSSLARMLDVGQGCRFEVQDADGRTVEVEAACVRGGDGEAAGYYALLRNQTEQRRYEKLLRQSNQLETVVSISAGIAHEVNNPLAFIRSNLSHIARTAGALRDEPGQDPIRWREELEELRQVAEESVEGLDRIGGTIERMRRFSKLKEGELGTVDINAVVRDAIRMAWLRGGEHLEVTTDLAPALPDVRGAAEHLVQALLILFDNAHQALAGQPDADLRVESRRCGDGVQVRVIDNGPGIPEALQQHIFNPFDDLRRQEDGRGVGLAIAFGIVREHGGMLDLESVPGEGTEFILTLPGL